MVTSRLENKTCRGSGEKAKCCVNASCRNRFNAHERCCVWFLPFRVNMNQVVNECAEVLAELKVVLMLVGGWV